MSIQYTYTSLTDAIKTYSEDTDPDFVAELPDFVGKAETRLLRDLDLELFEQWVQVTVSGSIRLVTKPADVIEVNDLWIRDPSTQKWLECPRRSFEYCIAYAPTEAILGVPRYYSEFDEDDFYVVPTPDQSYSGGNARIRATIRPTGLSTSNENTWLGDNMGDMLFEAAMIEAQTFLKNPAKVKEHAGKYQSLLPAIAREIDEIVRRRYKELDTGKKGADD
jgi:hypothetical protein